MTKIYLVLLFVFALLFINKEGSAQSYTITRGVLQGTVKDEKGNVLPGASVFIHDIKIGAIADTSGHYSTGRLNAGRYLVEVTYQGFASTITPVTINGNTIKDFALNTTAVEQEAVTVTGVSSATRIRNSPQPVSLVRKSELLQNASTNLINALARKPGVSVISTGPAISKPVIRGLGYNRLVTINDGVRQEGQQWGDEHGIEIDEFSVQRAEILKGPASLMYGSDAMAGVINFITSQPVSAGTIKGNLLGSYNGNNNMAGYHGNIAGNLNNGFNWNAYGSFKSAGDYRNKYDGRVLNSRFNEKNWGGYFGINKHWGYSHLIITNYRQNVGLTEGLRDSATGRFLIYPESAHEAVATEAQLKSKELTTPFQSVNHFKIASDNSFSIGKNRLSVTLAMQQNKRREYGNPDAVTTPDLFFDLKSYNYNIQYHLGDHSGWKTAFGFNGMYQQNRNLAEEKLIPAYNLFDAGVFGHTIKSFNKVTLSGGLRVDMRKIDIEGYNEAGFQKFNSFTKKYGNISGSAGLAYEASDAVTIKVNIAKGYRAPNPAELSSNGAHEGTYRYEYGNNNLKTENSIQFDAGLEVVSKHATFGFNAFYNNINNYIYYNRLEAAGGGDSIINDNGEELQAFAFNQARASLAGIEANLDIHPHPLDWLHFENTLSFVAGRFDNPVGGSRYLPSIPPAHLISELRANFAKAGSVLRNLYFKAEMDLNASQNRAFTGFNTETRTPGYTLFNLGAGSDIFSRKTHLFTIYLSFNNITDVAYQSHLSRLKYADVNNVTGRQGVFNIGRNFNVKVNVPLVFKK